MNVCDKVAVSKEPDTFQLKSNWKEQPQIILRIHILLQVGYVYVTFIERFVHFFSLRFHEPMSLFLTVDRHD